MHAIAKTNDGLNYCWIILRIIMMTINIVYLVIGMSMAFLGVMGFLILQLQIPYTLVYFIILTVSGIILTFVAIIGICGAVRGMWPVLIVYSVFIFGIYIIYLGVGNYALVERDIIIVAFNKQFQIWMHDYPNYQNIVDMYQRSLHCCGTEGPSSWAVYNHNIPASCCIYNNGYQTCPYNWKQGCELVVDSYISYFTNIIGGINAFIADFQAVVFVLTLCLIGVTIAIEKRRRMENSPLLQPTTIATCTPNNTMIQQ